MPQPQLPRDPNEIRTLFISGFPDDVKERELNNLLRFVPGYEASQLSYKPGVKRGQSAHGFALFETQSHARAAINSINNLCFDEEKRANLRAEFAKKNLYLREDGRPDEPYPKRPRRMDDNMDNPPSTTLFIGNLSSHVDDVELKEFFSGFKGFQHIRINHLPKGTNCFVAYMEQGDADAVHRSQQGAILESNSSRGGLRIQYAKNPLRRPQESPPYQGGVHSGGPPHSHANGRLQISPALQGGPEGQVPEDDKHGILPVQ